jgi:hypothetical protein
MAEVDESAVRVEGGSIVFVVEHRRLPQVDAGTGGPTIRVLGTADGHEYLRFDMFKVNAHYHYEPPSPAPEKRFMLDTVAEGDPVPWLIDRLRHRLGPMLTEAGGAALVEGATGAGLQDTIAEVERALAALAAPA